MRMKSPEGLGEAGQALWDAIVAESGIAIRADELLLIGEAAQTADVLEELRSDGGDPREIRLQQESLRKLLRSVDWPHAEPASDAGRALAQKRWRVSG